MEINQPKVSVIIPVYGVEKYIERCARSLFEQTLDNIEYIFIDDCTEDKSIDILLCVLDEYPLRKEQIIIHKMILNSGQAAVRQWGIQHASGEYVIHCDGDDWMDNSMCEKLYNKAVLDNADIVICDFFRVNGENYRYQRVNDKSLFLPQGPVWNKLVRRSICTDHKIMCPVANKAEDGVLVTQYVILSQKIVYLHDALYYYLVSDSSMCCNISEESCLSKLTQECLNLNVKVEFLVSQGLLHKYETDVKLWKYFAKENIAPLLSKPKYYDLWKRTYPELNKQLLFDMSVPIGIKIKTIMRLLKFGL